MTLEGDKWDLERQEALKKLEVKNVGFHSLSVSLSLAGVAPSRKKNKKPPLDSKRIPNFGIFISILFLSHTQSDTRIILETPPRPSELGAIQATQFFFEPTNTPTHRVIELLTTMFWFLTFLYSKTVLTLCTKCPKTTTTRDDSY